MDRLTCYFDDETSVLRGCCTFDRESEIEPDDCISCGEMCEEKDGDCEDCPIQKAFNKMAEYEDLEEQGLLVKLPCKVRGSVYWLNNHYSVNGNYKVTEETAVSFTLDEELIVSMGGPKEGVYGKTVFRTREEAEQALYELEGK